ncbi:hypothetical protein [Algicola sagamiensis]|uniref:hypothetical protein n=1 Tax=Algicola sagamiensis TaxID=163869 RepID=UPI000381F1E5|nr:hypothetical protein [Algicola sagamiensis]
MKIDWETGTPERAGLYFVAFKLGPLAGNFDYLDWDGQRWVTEQKGDVIAFVDAYKLSKIFNIEWPEPDPEIDYKPKDDGEEDSWVEAD